MSDDEQLTPAELLGELQERDRDAELEAAQEARRHMLQSLPPLGEQMQTNSNYGVRFGEDAMGNPVILEDSAGITGLGVLDVITGVPEAQSPLIEGQEREHISTPDDHETLVDDPARATQTGGIAFPVQGNGATLTPRIDPFDLQTRSVTLDINIAGDGRSLPNGIDVQQASRERVYVEPEPIAVLATLANHESAVTLPEKHESEAIAQRYEDTQPMSIQEILDYVEQNPDASSLPKDSRIMNIMIDDIPLSEVKEIFYPPTRAEIVDRHFSQNANNGLILDRAAIEQQQLLNEAAEAAAAEEAAREAAEQQQRNNLLTPLQREDAGPGAMLRDQRIAEASLDDLENGPLATPEVASSASKTNQR